MAIIVMGLSLIWGPQVFAANDELRVMTYNLRFAGGDPSPNTWAERLPLVREVLESTAPDIIGTQEGLYRQMKDLARELPEYDWIGLGRYGGSRSEFSAIFYRKTRFEPMEFDHFWLSDTPETIGSMTWGPTLPRMVTWVRFKDRQTNREFYFFNTHFDHKVEIAREKSAQLVRDRVANLNAALPVLLVGDFNAAAPGSKTFEILTNEKFFEDTWDTAKERSDAITGTFNGFKAIQPQGKRIDWILTRGDVQVRSMEIVTFSKEGRFPSDHFPVLANLTLGK